MDDTCWQDRIGRETKPSRAGSGPPCRVDLRFPVLPALPPELCSGDPVLPALPLELCSGDPGLPALPPELCSGDPVLPALPPELCSGDSLSARSSSSSRSSGVCFGVFGASSSAEACGFGVFGASSSAEACGFGVFGASSSAEACGFGVFGASSSAEACGFGVLAAFFSYEVFGFRVFGFGACFVFGFELSELSLQVKAGSLNQLLLEKPPCSEVLAPVWLVFGWPASQSLVWDRDLLGRPRFLEAWCGQRSAHFLDDILQSFSKPRCPRPLAPMGWPLLQLHWRKSISNRMNGMAVFCEMLCECPSLA